ncbi:hypothetical protein BJ322DRAFT_1053976 [Thelephora terrestris]|uniref:DUF423-domain-containing protein n=1 Tax=Thelephora terrestris TaxID=56493 RepID=A0A9P6L8I5_9AGAM|nr:hypothetical protein BJ322DRAFT_1053976 [Thelephora terrestris]
MSTTPLLPRNRMVEPLVNSTNLWRSGAVLVAVGISAAAFGAHALKSRPGMTPERVASWVRGANYMTFNGIALLAVSQHKRFATHKFAGPAILGGAILFSGSILALSAFREKVRFLGPITPLGGVFMVAGYVALAL